MSKMKILCVGVLSFILSYCFNPLNDIMQESLRGPVRMFVGIGPGLIVTFGKFILLAMVVGLPCLFLGPQWRKNAFLRAGLFLGLISSVLAVSNFILFEKGELQEIAWFIIAPSFILIYFVLGAVTGGVWGIVGNKLFRQATT
jgi:hypothetical protein